MSDKQPENQPKDRPEGADWYESPKAPAATPNPSPEDANITPKTTPQQQSS